MRDGQVDGRCGQDGAEEKCILQSGAGEVGLHVGAARGRGGLAGPGVCGPAMHELEFKEACAVGDGGG